MLTWICDTGEKLVLIWFDGAVEMKKEMQLVDFNNAINELYKNRRKTEFMQQRVIENDTLHNPFTA